VRDAAGYRVGLQSRQDGGRELTSNLLLAGLRVLGESVLWACRRLVSLWDRRDADTAEASFDLALWPCALPQVVPLSGGIVARFVWFIRSGARVEIFWACPRDLFGSADGLRSWSLQGVRIGDGRFEGTRWLMLLEGARMVFDNSEVSIGLLGVTIEGGSGELLGSAGVAPKPACAWEG
jgi:hypothetical protein